MRDRRESRGGWAEDAPVIVGLLAVAVVLACKPETPKPGGPGGPRNATLAPTPTCVDTARVRAVGRDSTQWPADSTGEPGHPTQNRTAHIVAPIQTTADSARPFTEGRMLGRLNNDSSKVPIPQVALGQGGHSYYWVQDCDAAQGGRVAALISVEETGYRIYRRTDTTDVHGPGKRVGWSNAPSWPAPIDVGGSLGGVAMTLDSAMVTAAALPCGACSGSWCRP